MQNTTENVAVETKTEVVAAPAAETVPVQISSMAEQLESTAPEKRRVFRKACNHTARSVLLQMLIMNGIVALGVAAIALISVFVSGDMTMDSQLTVILTFAFTALGGTLANIIAGVLHSKKRGYNPGESFKEGRMTFGLFSGGAVVGIGAMYLWAYIYQLIQYLTGYTDPMSEQSLSQAEALLSVKSPVAMVIYCLYVCVLAPITEEYLFRGVLLKTLSKYNVTFAAFATSLMFGLLHANLNQTPGTFLFGLVMAYVAIRSGSIRTPIILHMFLNIYSTVMAALQINMPENELTIGIVGLVLNVLFIVGAVVIMIVGLAKKKFKWEAAEPTTNHTLLPKVNSRVKFHIGHFFTCSWVLVLIYICVELILFAGGFGTIFEIVINAIKTAIAA